jgi:Na+/H+-translocating membrane pyrophosphatase
VTGSTTTDRQLLDDRQKNEMIEKIGNCISEGAREFLMHEYRFLIMFLGVFSLIILVAVDIFG